MIKNENNTYIEKAILSAVAYFDIFDYPLTLLEIWQNLYFGKSSGKKNIKLSEIINELENNPKLLNLIETKNGFYFFKGKSKIVETRFNRYNLAEKKYKKALKIGKIFRLIPFIEMMAICNSLSYSNSRDESDIDFFIITEKNRLWLTRLLSVSITKFLNLRPRATKTKNKICLSFFISEEFLNLEKIAYPYDIHFEYWLNQIYPIYGFNDVYKKFIKDNYWTKKELPNLSGILPNFRRKINKSINFLSFLNLPMFDFLEYSAKIFQEKILPDYLKNIANLDGRVIINDKVLKFHSNDRRLEYQNYFTQKMASFY